MDIWAWHVYVCMIHDACGRFVVCFCVWRSPFGALLRNILRFHTYAYVAGVVWDAWARNILVCHTIVSRWSVAVRVCSFVVLVRWFFVRSLFLVLCLSLCFFLFFFTRTSGLAPTARTSLDFLGHATFIFGAVGALLVFDFHLCPTVFDVATQRRKIFGGFLRSEKTIFPFICSGCVFFSWFFLFFSLQLRAAHLRCISFK